MTWPNPDQSRCLADPVNFLYPNRETADGDFVTDTGSIDGPETDVIADVRAGFGTFREGLRALEARLDDAEMQAALRASVAHVLEMKGRLIVTGIGKSGHIGSKLAATFASTGTPAFFVHPSEASHGDLGMIRSEDVVLMISWGGETRELGDMVTYTRRFQVPLILLTGKAESSLGKAADICLALPKVREACPHNLAPTTSTLLQLAMGDALAVALLRARGFSEKSFFNFHPGGKLGAGLTDVGAIMHKGDDVPLVAETAPVMDAVNALWSQNLGIVGVVSTPGILTGVVTDGDLRRYLAGASESSMNFAMHGTQVNEIMTKKPICLDGDTLAAEALNIMQTRRISAAFVTSKGRPLGVVTLLNLLNKGVA